MKEDKIVKLSEDKFIEQIVNNGTFAKYLKIEAKVKERLAGKTNNDEEYDLGLQMLLGGDSKSYKAKVFFSCNNKNEYVVGLELKHKNKRVYRNFSKSEALSLAEVLNQYASKLDEINSEEL